MNSPSPVQNTQPTPALGSSATAKGDAESPGHPLSADADVAQITMDASAVEENAKTTAQTTIDGALDALAAAGGPFCNVGVPLHRFC
ncbi:MAG TPA: hypothetical protein VGY54_08715, partial [Polyangiaceae bacterium]|nr:hypothetical protein [Polyangiaceae bacterium]